MLTIWGKSRKFCDRINRRDFLRIGAAGGMLSLADVLRLQAQANPAGKHSSSVKKSVIMVTLIGGAGQNDTWDLKPDAPAEYRGPFSPIKTKVPGIDICELFPKQAAVMDKLALIRSLSTTAPNGHGDSELLTGYSEAATARVQHPCFGAVISKLRGASAQGIPPYTSMRKMTFPTPTPLPQFEYFRNAGYLGSAHGPFLPTGPGMKDFEFPPSVDAGRFRQRMDLLSDFDRMRRDLDTAGSMAALDTFQGRAVDIVTSQALRNALDLSKEDPRTVDRYSVAGGPKNVGFAAGYGVGTQLLLARRLVEAGAGFVEAALGYWDMHGPAHILGFPKMRDLLCPMLDQALSALIEDLHQRGMENDVVVVVWGEFGRSPRINKDAGRDHWLPAMSALIAGGGLKTGQVIGSTDSRAEYPIDRPYKISNVLATIYRTIGIDPGTTFVNNNGRPTPILEDREPVVELI